MVSYLNMIFPDTRPNQRFWAYSAPHQQEAATALRSANFDVREGFFDADSQLMKDALLECRNNPQKMVFILATDDGDFIPFIKELKRLGVEVYLWASDDCSLELAKAVGTGFIHWNTPYVVVTCMNVIKELKGKQISRASFGTLCKQSLDDEECYPDDVGFSRRNPYGSLLRWLEQRGLITVKEVGGKSEKISIQLVARRAGSKG